MIRITEITDKKTWEDFVLNNPQQNFLQSWYWGEFNHNLGNKIFRLGFFSPKLRGVCLLIKQEAKRGNYLECPGGPIIDWEKRNYFEEFVQLIKKIAQKENCWFVRVRPQILNNEENHQLFKSFGFVPAQMHLHAEETWQLNLSESEEEIFKNMEKNHRYEIRKSDKRGVKVIFSKETKDVEILYRMQLETAKRHRFVPFSKNYLLSEFKAFLENDNVLLLKAKLQDEPVATAMIIYYGKEAVYHHAATTIEARKVSAAYGILWAAIKEAKRREMKRFNFWGIAPEIKKGHRYRQLNHFKKGFSGYKIDYLHAQDLPVRSNYWVTYIFESLRRKLRRL